MSRDADRLWASARADPDPLADPRAWLLSLRERPTHAVELAPLDQLDAWSFTGPRQTLAHRSGGFFRACGVRVEGELGRWDQPLVEQPELGTLGFLVAEIDGLLHALVQAKLEPGSPGLVQLAPTLQATHSNAARLHGGRGPAFAGAFAGSRPLAAAALSELGAHFSFKRNRNVIIEAAEPFEAPEGFRWLSLAELCRLAREPDVLNMPARSVLALALSLAAGPDPATLDRAEHPLAELRAWLAARAEASTLELAPRPLTELRGWHLHEGALSDIDGRLWSVVGVHVQAPEREVGEWSQPLLRCAAEGDAALVIQPREGALHLLLEARRELGTGVTLAPTITADAGLACPWERRASPLAGLLDAAEAETLLDVRQAREGGRYWRSRHRYRIVRLPEGARVSVPPTHRWVSLSQLRWLLCRGEAVHLDARELLAMLPLELDELARTQPSRSP